jgi:CII-binding regulator of phage lambda lysogenization HflD
LGTRPDAITHDKYTLGLLLNIENLHRDILQLDNNNNNDDESEVSKQLLNSIIDRYLNNSNYFFADMFGQFSKGQIILQSLYPYLIKSTTGHLELILIRLYSSLTYMISRWPTTFHIEPIVMNTISLMQQQVNVKKITFEQLLAQVYTYYNEQIKPKLTEFDSGRYFF